MIGRLIIHFFKIVLVFLLVAVGFAAWSVSIGFSATPPYLTAVVGLMGSAAPFEVVQFVVLFVAVLAYFYGLVDFFLLFILDYQLFQLLFLLFLFFIFFVQFLYFIGQFICFLSEIFDFFFLPLGRNSVPDHSK